MVYNRRPGNGRAVPTLDPEAPGNNRPPLWAGGGGGGVGAALPPFSGSASRSRLHLLFLLQVGGRPAPARHASGKRPPALPRSSPNKRDPVLVSRKAGLRPAARAAERMGAAVRKTRSCHCQAERSPGSGTFLFCCLPTYETDTPSRSARAARRLEALRGIGRRRRW